MHHIKNILSNTTLKCMVHLLLIFNKFNKILKKGKILLSEVVTIFYGTGYRTGKIKRSIKFCLLKGASVINEFKVKTIEVAVLKRKSNTAYMKVSNNKTSLSQCIYCC